jgi:hypothetical protein
MPFCPPFLVPPLCVPCPSLPFVPFGPVPFDAVGMMWVDLLLLLPIPDASVLADLVFGTRKTETKWMIPPAPEVDGCWGRHNRSPRQTLREKTERKKEHENKPIPRFSLLFSQFRSFLLRLLCNLCSQQRFWATRDETRKREGGRESKRARGRTRGEKSTIIIGFNIN